jgi:hypothetical protein
LWVREDDLRSNLRNTLDVDEESIINDMVRLVGNADIVGFIGSNFTAPHQLADD